MEKKQSFKSNLENEIEIEILKTVLFLPGIIITGGFINKKYQNLAEAFNSWTKVSNRIGKLKHARAGHTFCNNMVCGGTYFNPEAYKTCERFDVTGSFTSLPVRLVERRVNHLC